MSKKAIPLIKGDDTNWNNQQTFSIKLSTSIDLDEGFSAEFRIGNVVKTFDKIVSNKITPILTSEDTASLPLGYNNGILKLFDSEGRTRTVKSNIPFIVKNGVITPNGSSNSNSNNCNCDCCDNDGYNPPEEIDVIIDDGEIVDYNSLANIPTINGVEVKGNLTSADLGLGGVEGDFSSFATKEELNQVSERVSVNSNDITEIKADFVELNTTLEGIETELKAELALKTNKTDVYTKEEVDNQLNEKVDNTQLNPLVEIVNQHGTKITDLENNKANSSEVYKKEETDANIKVVSDALEKLEEKAVVYKDFTFNGEVRQTIQLDNYDSISGVSTKGNGCNLVMLSKYDVADFGDKDVHANINTSQIVTVNDTQAVLTDALLERIVLSGENVKVTKQQLEDPATGFKFNAYQLSSDFSSLATKEELTNKENALKTDLQAVSEQVAQLSTNKAEKTELEAVSSNLSNLTDDVATLTNQVSGYGESINDLTLKATDLENNKASKSEIPTLTSQLTNDSGFISSIPEEYITENDLSDALKDKADITSIPTKISSLENDSGYLNTIPEEYVTETELESKGYLTEHQDISGKADKSDVYTKQEAEAIFYQKQQWVDATLGINSSEENAVKNALTGSIAGEENTFSSAINVLDNQISENTLAIANKADKSTTYTKEEVNGLLPSIATAMSIGLVRPDGVTITITDDGIISAATSGEIANNVVSKEEYEAKVKELEQTISQLQEQIGNLTQQVVTLQSNIDTVEDQMLFSGDTVIDDL